MTAHWRIGPASRACLLACAFGGSTARADEVKLVVTGTLVCTASKADRTIGLYAEKSPDRDSEMASYTTKPDGKFRLSPTGTTQRLRMRNLWVVCRPQGDAACTPHQLAATGDGPQQNNLTFADVELTCTPDGTSPAKTAEGVAALAETHEVLTWAGVEDVAAADAALKGAVARADGRLNPDERERFKTALAAAAAPLRDGSHRGLQLLPSLQHDDFAEELIAAAPGWRWLRRPERNDRLPTPYRERDDRFEGSIVHRVGSTFSDALVSLSEGPISVDPETQASLELTWPRSAGPRECLEASPIVPGVGWKMREAAAVGSASFTWDLSTARSEGVKKGTLGVVARRCSDAEREQGPYIPVRAGATAANGAVYRLVFLFPRQLTSISLTVFQGEAAARHTIKLPRGTIKFDPHAQTPTVVIDVPTSNLEPGLVDLEMSGRGPGGFGPEQLSFVHPASW